MEGWSTQYSANPVAEIRKRDAKEETPSSVVLNDLTGEVYKDEDAVGGGSYSDVYTGLWMTGKAAALKVAIKVFRSHIYSRGDILKLDEILKKEMHIWGSLKHPNIVLFYGIAFDFGKGPAMVSQWMNQGALLEYVEKERSNLDFRARLNICIAIAHGLSYLHSNNVIHGDLSPANVLMDQGVPHISNFGLSDVVAELQGPFFFTVQSGTGARWISPELLQSADGDGVEGTPVLTMSCDVYSFASLVFYVVTGFLPYAHRRSNVTVIMEIMQSMQSNATAYPPRPAQSLLTDECWAILMQCWALDPAKRPNIHVVYQLLEEL
ncbi:kinase-like protein [Pholiota conissans]|uniref:Kinase-like protein n=1 Tax=Pholiota conissans TaxID=109636 RepID=A0A9P5YP05_9AGAR|nr:kinase-like protein [Pholiota conissans]